MFYRRIVHAGVKEEYPEYLQRKITVSNVVILYLILSAGIPFILISIFFFQPALWIPVVSVVLGLLSILLNRVGLMYAGRLLASFAPVVAAVLYNAYLSIAGEMPVASLALLALSFSLVPFLVFDVREKGYLILSFVILVTIFSMFDYLNVWLEVALDTEIIRTGYLSKIATFTAYFSCVGSILVLTYHNYSSERKVELLLQQAKENREMSSVTNEY